MTDQKKPTVYPPFKMVQYNMGTDENDVALRTGVPEPNYEMLQEQTAMAMLENRFNDRFMPGVYFLQEVNIVPGKRPLVEELIGEGFIKVCRPGAKKPDCVVMLDKSRFQLVENHSCLVDGMNDVAMAEVVDLETQRKYLFVSAHVPGCPITKTGCSGPETGNDYCLALLRILAKFPLLTVVIGADMNANPENCPMRFKLFEDYTLIRTVRRTAVKFGDSYRDREIDFFWVRDPLKGHYLGRYVAPMDMPPLVYRLLSEKEEPELKFRDTQPEIAWYHNASDHFPIYATVHPREVEVPKELPKVRQGSCIIC